MAKFPRLHGSLEYGQGTVSWPDDWHEMDALLRCDLLTDWIYALQEAKNIAFNRFHTELREERNEPIELKTIQGGKDAI